jgi:hypothetical protein
MTGSLLTNGDIYTVPWTDYSGTSTIIGWASFSNKELYYKKIGKLVFCQFFIYGASNSINTSFTLPYSNSGGLINVPIVAINNTSEIYGGIVSNSSGAKFDLFVNVWGGTWSATGDKSTRGQFFYETA